MAEPKQQKEIAPKLPYSQDAEVSVLGAILLNNSYLDAAAEIIRPDDFFFEQNSRIFSAFLMMQAENSVIDLVTLTDKLDQQKVLEAVGGAIYVSKLIDGVPHVTNIAHYARIVKEKSQLRSVIKTSEGFQKKAFQAGDPKEVVGDIEKYLQGFYDQAESDAAAPVSMAEAVKELWPVFNRAFSAEPGKHAMMGTRTGYAALDEVLAGWIPGDLVILGARPSCGKAQPLTAPVKTVAGWKPIGNIEIGEELVSEDGKPSRVTGVFPQGQKEIYRITFSDFRSTEVCGDHLWRVQYRGWKPKFRILTTDQIALLLTIKRYQGRLAIPRMNGCYGKATVPMSGWLMGYLLGNGNLTQASPRVSIPDPETVERMNLELSVHGCFLKKESEDPTSVDYRIIAAERNGSPRHTNPVKNILVDFGLMELHCDGKFIPPVYFETPRHVRIELLRGLLDSDGFASKFKGIQFCSSSKRLALGLQQLVWSIGGIARISNKQPFFTYKGERREGLPAYIVGVIVDNPQEVFWLERKKVRATSRSTGRYPRLSILKVEKSRTADAVCISVSHLSQTYVTTDYLLTHNTALTLEFLRRQAKEGNSVLYFSLEMSRASLVTRLCCLEAGVDSHKVRIGNADKEDRVKLIAAMNAISNWPIWISEPSRMWSYDLVRRVRAFSARHSVKLVMVDYLQLLRARAENRQQEVGKIAQDLKEAARILGKQCEGTIVATAQLSRLAPNERPRLDHLRDSGEIEQSADVVLFLWNADDVEAGEKHPYRKMLGVSKQRNGPLSTMRLVFQAETNEFHTPTEEEWKYIGDLHKPKEGEEKKKRRRGGDD